MTKFYNKLSEVPKDQELYSVLVDEWNDWEVYKTFKRPLKKDGTIAKNKNPINIQFDYHFHKKGHVRVYKNNVLNFENYVHDYNL